MGRSILCLLSLAGLLYSQCTDAFIAPIGRPPSSLRCFSELCVLSSSPSREEGHQYVDDGSITSRQHQRRREFVQSLASSGIVASGVFPFPKLALADADQSTITDTIDPSYDQPKITKRVYLDIKFDNYKEPKRLLIGLFGEVMPRTVENFLTLCTNTDGPSYSGASFYRGTLL